MALAQMVKYLPAAQETGLILGWEDPVDEGNGSPFSSILAWRISWTEEPGGLQSMWLQEPGTLWLKSLLCFLDLLISSLNIFFQRQETTLP